MQEPTVHAYDLAVEEARDRLVLATAGDSSSSIHVSFEAFFGATADCRTLVRVQYSPNVSHTEYPIGPIGSLSRSDWAFFGESNPKAMQQLVTAWKVLHGWGWK